MTCEHGHLNAEAEKMNRFGVYQRNDPSIMEGFHICAVVIARLITYDCRIGGPENLDGMYVRG
jgi:hypothetical protein